MAGNFTEGATFGMLRDQIFPKRYKYLPQTVAIRHKIINGCCYMKIVISIQLPKSWFSFLRLKISQKPDNATKLRISRGNQIAPTGSKQLKAHPLPSLANIFKMKKPHGRLTGL
jgi:hypothetical protein